MVLALLPGAACGLSPTSSPQRYSVQGWNTESGLPQNSVHAMLQTTDGYLWMATENGLARFNGYQYRVFGRETQPQLAGNDIRALFEDRQRALWVGTATGLTRLSDGVAHSYTTREGLPSDAVRSVLQTKDGKIWVLTSAGVATIAEPATTDAGKLHFQTVATGPAAVQTIAEAPEGGVWAATDRGIVRIADGRVQPEMRGASHAPVQALTCALNGDCAFASTDGVFLLRHGALQQLALHAALPAGGVRSLLITPDGVWAAGESALLLLQPHRSRVFKAGADLPGRQIESLFADNRGAVWIGTDDGVARWWGERMESTGVGNASAVLSFYEDRDGDLWLGTETTGVFELRDRPFDLIGRAQDLGDGSATSVTAAGPGSLWVGTSAGGLNRVDGQAIAQHVLTLKEGLASNTVLSLATSPKDSSDVWIGTPDGLSHWEKGHLTNYTVKDGLTDDFVRSLLVANDGSTWIGTRHGVTRWRNKSAATWTTKQGLGSDLIGAMAEDAAGDLWVGTRGGLALFHNNSVHNYTVADGLPSDTITSLSFSKGGDLWIGTNGSGLGVRSGRSFFVFPASAGLPKAIFAILEDDAGFLWLSSEYGLDRVALTDLAAYRSGSSRVLAVTHFGAADGLESSEGSATGHPSAVRLADGRLCFVSRRGVLTVDPALLPVTRSAPPIVIEEMTADDRDVTPEELASLPPGVSHLSISFAGIHLTAPQRLHYRYMLEGFDRNWIDAGTQRTAFYTNLPPGSYRFRVNVRSAGGPWSEQGMSSITVGLRPRYYQTGWFRALLLCAFALGLLGLYRMRLRALNARFQAVAEERSRLAREIHDTLAQGFVAVSVRLEMLSRILHGERLEECRQELNETRTLVQEGLAEARRSIWNLRAEDADRVTLPAHLERIVKDTIERGVDAELEITGAYRALPSTVEAELIRMTQEAVSNALRHADPCTILVRLLYTPRRLRLEIQDDGCGFDVAKAPSKESGHYGLTGLRERAQKIGATFMLESSPGNGTAIRIETAIVKDREKGSRS
ncbi:fused histidine kinase/response regulator [Terriglobus roseus DSM 18391]|uniref:Fused histidine kinase/response regulator n=1 Tax=Terriglobus roseus (strain DSM 18391 / NRRL B-41598 / KBS 63) TaxID=926566 RepID=I3ZIS8_TERRK|nr:sensor histidine kinase [Terriglobus roseus]AFL89146.1 fused histidine kinase/response regulator [Terriglobus roseus DSM 18391]